MLTNYFMVFLRNLRQQKTVAIINVAGLAVGLCVFIMIGLYVQGEYSYESRWRNADRTVRLLNTIRIAATTAFVSAGSSGLALPALRRYFPDRIEKAARVWPRGQAIRIGDDTVQGNVYLVDRDFIDIFDFETVAGNLADTLAATNRIALNETEAGKLFKGESALGKRLTLQVAGVGDVDYEVTAIYRVPPGKGRLQFANFSLLDEQALPDAKPMFTNWWGNGSLVGGFLLLRPGTDVAALNAGLDTFVDANVT
ncbi:MAG TPA: ABC transporter permease, partial [Candidatus Acidoferrum sp.]|nr:ABC transporter permease [Candidatus Acidoferrum sp.]